MTYTLIKCSTPGWTKDFETEEALKIELFSNICSFCVNDVEYNGTEFPLSETSHLGDLLCTGCGCEFMVELDGELI